MEQNPSSPAPQMAPVQPVVTSPQSPVPTPSASSSIPTDNESHKFVAALSYLGILVFVPLLLKRDSAFARKHSAQGVLLLATWMIALFLVWIPVIGWILGIVLGLVHLFAFLKCLQGEFWEVPVIGSYRQKLLLD
jgi:uncharacterized membrane protein